MSIAEDVKLNAPKVDKVRQHDGFNSLEQYVNFKNSLGRNLKVLNTYEIVKKIESHDKDFSNVKIVGVDWARRDLSEFDFSGSKIEWCVFSDCKLMKANFSKAFVDWCVFFNANISSANFKNRVVWNSIFDGATVNEANFSNCDMRHVVWTNVIGMAKFDRTMKFRFIESWSEITERDFEVALGVLGTLNIPLGQLMKIKAIISSTHLKIEKFRAIYDVGRKTMSDVSTLYVPLHLTKETQTKYSGKSSIYIDRSDGYASKTPYREHTSKKNRVYKK